MNAVRLMAFIYFIFLPLFILISLNKRSICCTIRLVKPTWAQAYLTFVQISDFCSTETCPTMSAGEYKVCW